uniref:Uncharacterized protein n=1 Tax=Anguilla anguilla TaxID=7936 RepID=A0A0E9R8W5_ANGAN
MPRETRQVLNLATFKMRLWENGLVLL